MFDDPEPRAKKAQLKPLDDMSIDNLESYIVELQIEIERVKTAIRAKQSYAETAALFFKKAE